MSHPFSPRNSSPASFVRVNDKIRAREVRVIAVDGRQLGVIPLTDALNLARQHGVDLVEIAAAAVHARLSDWWISENTVTKSPRRKRKPRNITTPQSSGKCGISPRIDPHDLGIKLTHAVDFSLRGHEGEDRAEISRTRKWRTPKSGFAVINKFLADIAPTTAIPIFHQNSSDAVSTSWRSSPLPRNKRGKNPNPERNPKTTARQKKIIPRKQFPCQRH